MEFRKLFEFGPVHPVTLSPLFVVGVVLVLIGLATYSLYHLGLGVADKSQVIAAYHAALSAGAPIVKPPRTTWRGTPLHELWLRDPSGYLIEVYARLTAEELAQMPADQEPCFLVPGTRPPGS